MFGVVRRRMASPLSTIALANVVVMVIGIVGGVFQARVLGPTERGSLAGAYTWITGLMLLACGGFDQSVVYLAARESLTTSDKREGQRKQSDVWSTSLAWSILQAAVGIVLVGIAVIVLPRTSGTVRGLRGYALWPIGAAASGAVLSYEQGAQNWRVFNLGRIGVQAAMLGGVAVAVIAARPTAASVASLQSFALAAVALPLIYFSKKRVHDSKVSRGASRKLITYGAKALPGELLWFATLRFDQLFLAVAAPARSLGYYTVAVSVASMTAPIGMAISWYSFSEFASQEDSGGVLGNQTRAKIRTRLVRTAVSATALAAAMVAIAGRAVPYVFGQAYLPARVPTVILVIASVPLTLKLVICDVLRGLGKPGFSAIAETLGAAVMIPAVVLAVPRWGPAGAAVASLVAYSMTAGVGGYLLHRAMAKTAGARESKRHEEPGETRVSISANVEART